jgi:DNA repair exonuclease SbcCD nuclease subunit
MDRIRFIHTSDVHLDTSFAAAGLPLRLGSRKREAIRATFRRILEDARSQSVDFLLIAGDLFEHDRITSDTIEFLRQQLESLEGIPVFIAPGNHDPYLSGSPYAEERWPENVHIFCEEEFRSVELADLGVRVTGFGFNHTVLDYHHFSRLPALPADGINIVVSHGSDIRNVPEGKARHGPFTIDEIAGKNVHYCALGHYHQQRPVPNTIDGAAVWYCGIPEGRTWDEAGGGGYLLGEIAEGRVKVTGVVANHYPLQTISIDCEGFATREQIIEAILEHRGTYFDPRTILRIRLTGALDPRLDLSLDEMAERLAESILHIQWEDRTSPALDYSALAQEGTLCGLFVRRMNDRISGASGEERAVLERARQLGVQALHGREVRLR